MKALVLVAALAAGLTAPAFAGDGGGDSPPGFDCHVGWAPMAEPTPEPLPVTLYAPYGIECW